jgi:hypothetical protein
VARWAQQTCGGVASVQRLAGNVGYLDLQPILFPAVIGAELITAALSLVAATEALIIDAPVPGGELAMAAFLISYLWATSRSSSPAQERRDDIPAVAAVCARPPLRQDQARFRADQRDHLLRRRAADL